MKKVVLGTLFLALVLAGAAYAATWRCAYCGRKQSSPQMPPAMSNCPGNPQGKFHVWVKIS